MFKYLLLVILALSEKSLAFNFNQITYFFNPVDTRQENIKFKDHTKLIRIPQSIEDVPQNYINNYLFWHDVYLKYKSDKILIHSKMDLSNVFEVIDLELLYSNEPNSIIAEIKKNKLVSERVKKIKNEIIDCYERSCDLQINKNISLEKQLKSLRTQTGQNDILSQGIKRFKLYENTIRNIFVETNSDPDWLAVPFLESSFNPLAISKVGATGTWQIMEYIGKRLMPVNKYVDARKNPILATYAGLKILRQNRIITKNKDISVVAYNSGLRNYFKIRKKLKKKVISTEEFLKTSKRKTNYFDFASENFLMEYFAMIEYLKQKNIHFENRKSRNISSRKDIYHPYISKCKTRPKKVLKLLRRIDPNIMKFNNHFKNSGMNRILKPGQIYLSKIDLPSKYYKRVKVKGVDKMAPKNWKTTQKSCSII